MTLRVHLTERCSLQNMIFLIRILRRTEASLASRKSSGRQAVLQFQSAREGRHEAC